MKLKIFWRVIASAILAGVLFTGCGVDENTSENQSKSKSDSTVGMISHMNVNEQKINELLKTYENKANLKFSREIIYYDNLSSMQMGLESKSIDEMSLYESTAEYLAGKNDKFVLLPPDKRISNADSFCCAIRSGDKELLDSINGTIESMKKDGTLEKFTKEYIVTKNDKNIAI